MINYATAFWGLVVALYLAPVIALLFPSWLPASAAMALDHIVWVTCILAGIASYCAIKFALISLLKRSRP